jgi:thiosulfate sulfurtransferase
MVTRVSLPEAQELLNNANLYLLDIRDQAAYATQHIENAQHLTREQLIAFAATADKNRPVLVYCYRGNSSQSVAQYLSEQGFAEVFSLDGGFETWRTQLHEKVTE